MQDHAVVVTGATGGLGSQLVRLLAASGHKLVLVDSPRAETRMQQLVREVGSGAWTHLGDLATGEAWEAILQGASRGLGVPLLGAALVAGGFAGGGPLHMKPDDDEWARMVRANLDTTRHALRALLPGMVEAGAGSVVVIGSRAVERPWTSAGSASYAATKSGAVAMAMVAAAEVLEHGVRINAVLPSTIDTPQNRASMPGEDPSRWVSPRSLAEVILFLLSDASRDISGAQIPVYGRA